MQIDDTRASLATCEVTDAAFHWQRQSCDVNDKRQVLTTIMTTGTVWTQTTLPAFSESLGVHLALIWRYKLSCRL